MFKNLFGLDTGKLWRRLAEEIGGTYVSDFWRDDRVLWRHRAWTVVLDIHHYGKGQRETRVRTSFLTRGSFWFTIYPRGLLSTAGKWLGMQDIDVGHSRFDDEYIIQGNDPDTVKALFANERIRFLIESLPEIRLCITDHDHSFWGLPPGVDELCLTTPEDLRDLTQLKLLFELFAETLDELERMGTLLPETSWMPPGEAK
jgi:hypothetical protein